MTLLLRVNNGLIYFYIKPSSALIIQGHENHTPRTTSNNGVRVNNQEVSTVYKKALWIAPLSICACTKAIDSV